MSVEEISECLESQDAEDDVCEQLNVEEITLTPSESPEPIEESQAALNDKVELDDIQTDINDLMSRLNSFIADSLNDNDVGSGDDCCEGNEEVTEKQDGPPEKELRYGNVSVDDLYITDGTNPPEINWNAVGPILQKHISDLQRLHNLNQLTITVVKRIRNMAQISEALLDEAKKQVQWDATEP